MCSKGTCDGHSRQITLKRETTMQRMNTVNSLFVKAGLYFHYIFRYHDVYCKLMSVEPLLWYYYGQCFIIVLCHVTPALKQTSKCCCVVLTTVYVTNYQRKWTFGSERVVNESNWRNIMINLDFIQHLTKCRYGIQTVVSRRPLLWWDVKETETNSLRFTHANAAALSPKETLCNINITMLTGEYQNIM